MKTNSNKNGIVLIIVLWVIVVMTTVSMAYVRQVQMELKMVGFQRDTAIVDTLANAGLRQAVILLREDALRDSGENIQGTLFKFSQDDLYNYDGGTDVWADNPALLEEVPFYESESKQGYFYVEIEDESSKLPLNNGLIQVESYAHLIELTGVDEDEAKTLAGAIFDWRDADNEPTMTGERHRSGNASSEVEFYNGRRNRRQESEIPEYVIKNNGFESIDELLLLPGMTPAIVYGTVDPSEMKGQNRYSQRRTKRGEYLGLVHFLTTHSESINLNTVKTEVLESVLFPVAGKNARNLAHDWTEYRDGSDKKTYTHDDKVMKSADNSDLDNIHITNISGFTQEMLNQLGAFMQVASSRFVVTVLADYNGIEKGYRAVIARQFTPAEQLPQFGIDTFDVEQLEQVKVSVLSFEPLFDAKKRMDSL